MTAAAIALSWMDLFIAALLVLALGGLALYQKLDITRALWWAALRCGLQLWLIGLVLKALLTYISLTAVIGVTLVMMSIAAHEVQQRQRVRFRDLSGYWISLGSMLLSAFSLTIFALALIVQPEPWYHPRYAIPLLGMMLGNTMNGIALALNGTLNTAYHNRALIEQRLMLGETAAEATIQIRRDAIRSALIPTINTMAVSGIVSLPGMMTGQILAGAQPGTAVKYQIMIMFMIGSGTGLGSLLAVYFSSQRLFDEREHLCVHRLETNSKF